MASFDYPATVLTGGVASGQAVVMLAPLSFWGGVDPSTGNVVDVHHPQAGTHLGGAVVVLPSTRGSNAGGTVLLECIRLGTGPAAIIMLDRTLILPVGALVASEIYGRQLPMVVMDVAVAGRIVTGDHVIVNADREPGRVNVAGAAVTGV